MSKGKKQPRAAITGPPPKRASATVRQPDDDRISWRFSRLDPDGPHGYARMGIDAVERVRSKLVHFESKSWNECTGKGMGAKRIPLENLAGAAQRRLEVLKQDDADALWEFHLSGPERVWGVRDRNVCYLLWWDPDHEVCPSKLRNT